MKTYTERIGIYGGTFSPIHSGHVRAALAFLKSMELDRLYVIPTASPPHKSEVAGANSKDRLEMVRLAFSDVADRRIEVSDFEIKREGKSYSIYTLEHFSKPGREIFMLVGTDMFLTLHEWYRAEDIFRIARIVLMRREHDNSLLSAINEKIQEYKEKYGANISIIDVPPLEISSTRLREMLQNGDPVDGLIPDNVIKYITDNNLYGREYVNRN
jgi:nicotinate-nucleotide adenylyltransferase